MPISNVVFDLGRVLLDFQYSDLLSFLREHGLEYQSVDELLDRMKLYAYESGELTDEEFMHNLNGLVTSPIDEETLRKEWTEVFTPIPPMIDLANRLMPTHRVYILSNASSMHWDYLQATYDIFSIGHGQLASFQAGMRKPDARIYRAAEDQFGLLPSETVFIDDLAENAEGARACGWHGIHHITPVKTTQALRDLGVREA